MKQFQLNKSFDTPSNIKWH